MSKIPFRAIQRSIEIDSEPIHADNLEYSAGVTIKEKIDEIAESSGSVIIEYISVIVKEGCSILKYDPVMLDDSEKASKFDTSNIDNMKRFVGISTHDGVAGETINVKVSGKISNNEWLFSYPHSRNVYVNYLGEINNNIDMSSSKFIQSIGYSVSNDAIVILPEEPEEIW